MDEKTKQEIKEILHEIEGDFLERIKDLDELHSWGTTLGMYLALEIVRDKLKEL